MTVCQLKIARQEFLPRRHRRVGRSRLASAGRVKENWPRRRHCTSRAREARFLSPDPEGLNPLSPVGLNRYVYASANPVKFFDPNGRAAIVTYDPDGDVTVQVPMKFSGPQANAANISSIKSDAAAEFSGTYQINGISTQVDFQVVSITPSTPMAVRNEAQLISGPTSHPSGRSFVNAVGGTTGEINMNSRGIPYGEAAHEMGHFAGAQDHYNYATQKPNAGYAGNLMGQLPGNVDSRNIAEILTNPHNIIRHTSSGFIGPRP